MKTSRLSDLTTRARARLIKRPGSMTVQEQTTVRRICREVQRSGDPAVRSFTRRYDKRSITSLSVPETVLSASLNSLNPALRTAFETAADNIRRFHDAQRRERIDVETMPGVVCWREARPIEAVGLYIPAGSAPLPSTVFMLGIPALLAGCGRIALCSPPTSTGTVDPIVCAAAAFLGIQEVYRIGGVQAIAAMAYGTESLPRVDKIFGPGNRFVTAAKQLVSTDPNGCAIDMLAGPSEVLIIADESADALTVAIDMISQAEHDPNAHALLLTTSTRLAAEVASVAKHAFADLSRRAIIRSALRQSHILVTSSLEDAIAFSNDYAPEHLIVNTSDPGAVIRFITNAGSVFLGAYSPVTAGDYASGTNHTLPTGGSARAESGISLASFQKEISFQRLTRKGLEHVGPTLTAFAIAEGLEGHKRAVDVRLKGSQ